ncbi:hypothetical protein [Microbacterium sp. cf332]|uniref:hypothetical protein n=1 Tax=Microbacterium sp. cf332 TaxID=1761804 RepID=UPI000886C9F7|nr:hypothetical protein [Microbacterium sp. cf332]SDQ09076.1 hypothetical protein SAMN04487847_0296 [Microbacterium sp. cf332]
MSDNEQQPPTPQLTRRQLRELRNTASTPIIVDPGATDEAAAIGAEPTPVAAPLPRPAEPVQVPPAPVPQASVDLGAPALTRRQARLQEKIRTASIPVITATGEHALLPGSDVTDRIDAAPDAEPSVESPDEAPGTSSEDAAERDEAAFDVDHSDETAQEARGDEGDEGAPDDVRVDAEETHADDPDADAEDADADAADADADAADADADAADADASEAHTDDATSEPEEERHVVSGDLGADLLAGASTTPDVPASFDQLLTRSATATGAFTTPSALILAQSPDGGPLVAPVTATGEVLITGTFSLPENFGSTGVVPGVADGKDVDAVLIDGELPASSSPTPIAASAAISTIKSAEDVIRPPAPEKGSRWTVALAITAGALALALAGVLLVSLFTGVFG